jgi:hydrogenase maturation protease
MSPPGPPPAPGPEESSSSTPRVLLLGLGNDILTDDAVGLHVVHELQRELAGHPSIDVRETTEMGLAGFLHELDAAAINQLTGRTPHFVGVSETLALGRQLGLAMPEQVRIFAIEVEDPFTLGTSLTPALQAALPGIVSRIRAAVQPLL